jgi:uncharacterized integral membrane protein (TIGR00698 family)
MNTNVDMRGITSYLPGLSLLIIMGGLLYILTENFISVNPLILAIVVGVLLGNTLGIPNWAEDGVGTYKLLLETGIVLMGIRITIGQIVGSGPLIFLTVLVFMAFTILYVEILSRKVFNLADRLGSLLAAGSSICGVSAIVAVAGSIRAKETEIAYGVATILLFDAITLAGYPLIGQLLELPDMVFGVWSGISMFSTGPVVAAGFSYSEQAGQWATITKLIRNLFIGFLAIAYALYYTRKQTSGSKEAPSGFGEQWRYLWDNFPKFVLGFALFILLANLGVLSDWETSILQNSYDFLFLFAFIGIGLNIQIDEMRDTGIKPIIVILVALLTVSVTSLFTSYMLFG